MTRNGNAETSSGFGIAVLTVGVVLWVLQFSFGVFTNWGWALVIGSAWTVLGVLLLFPDVRVYTGVRPPAEAYHDSPNE